MSTRILPSVSLNRSRLLVAVPFFFAFIAGLFGGTLVGLGLQDYSSYTATTTATVTDVVKKTSGSGRHYNTTFTYYVDYEADGQTFTHAQLNGVTTGRRQVGDTVTVVFPPGVPSKAVTVTTTSPGTLRVELWIGIGLLLVSAAILTVTITWLVRRRRRTRDALAR